MFRSKLWMAIGLSMAGLSLAFAAPLSAKTSYKGTKIDKIPGTHVKRITLSDVAVDRLAIETAKIREVALPERQTVEAEIVNLPEAFARATIQSAPLGLRINMAPTEDIEALLGNRWIRVDHKGRGYSAKWVSHEQMGLSQQNQNALYFAFNGQFRNLRRGDIVRATLDLPQRGTAQKAVPYSAILYEPDGSVWVYEAREGNVYERKSVVVDRIVNGVAYLKSGPPLGTDVVTVGLIEIYGVESGIGK